MKYLTEQGRCSRRHARVVIGLSRSLVRYIARQRKDEVALIRKIHKRAIRHSRYGYHQITALLRREGFGLGVTHHNPQYIWQDYISRALKLLLETMCIVAALGTSYYLIQRLISLENGGEGGTRTPTPFGT